MWNNKKKENIAVALYGEILSHLLTQFIMTEAGKNRSDRLDKGSINSITYHFDDIDKKILLLHDYSSQDFLKLNKILKNYFSQIKELSDNSTHIIDSISGKCSKDFSKELFDLQNKLNNPLNQIDDALNIRIEYLEKTLKVLDFIVVPLNNLKQNLMTFKLVLASVKLNNKIIKEESNKIKEFSDILDSLNKKIKELYGSIELKIKSIKSEIKDALFQQYHLKDTIAAETNNIKFNLQSSIDLISGKYQDIFSNIPQITEQAQLCFKNIDHIITNLQYHDIIRQKMTHIQEIQKDIIDDLNQFDKHGNKFETKYLNNIPHIAELQVAQLMLTNKEYQNAIEKITSELLDINDKTKIITNISLKVSEECKQSSKNNKNDLLKKEGQFNKLLTKTFNETEEFKLCVKKIYEYNKALTFDFNTIFEIKKDLSKLHDFLNEQNGKQVNFRQFIEKSNTLINDINSNNSEIKKLATSVNFNLEKLNNQNSELSEKNIAIFQNSGKKLFSSIVDHIKEYTNEIGQQLHNNIEISNKISEDIKASIKNIKYYQLFEQIIEEIIDELNSINQLLSKKKIIEPSTIKDKDLNKIKEKYTMQSERDIHDQILSKEKELGIEKNKSNEKEGDIELF